MFGVESSRKQPARTIHIQYDAVLLFAHGRSDAHAAFRCETQLTFLECVPVLVEVSSFFCADQNSTWSCLEMPGTQEAQRLGEACLQPATLTHRYLV